MMHGPGRGPDFGLQSEARKAQNISGTLIRLWRYFGLYWFVLVAVAVLVISTTYMQVITPDLLGQAVDCYLTPATTKAFTGGNTPSPIPSGAATRSTTNCWLGAPGPQATTSDYVAGLGALVLLLVGLYVAGALLTGLQFFLMNTTGFRVLRNLRVDIFHHIHRLSLGYFSEH